ncbi:MAG: Topoisomerase IV subunit A, partial [uncultured Quadrisphaera sp.]
RPRAGRPAACAATGCCGARPTWRGPGSGRARRWPARPTARRWTCRPPTRAATA